MGDVENNIIDDLEGKESMNKISKDVDDLEGKESMNKISKDVIVCKHDKIDFKSWDQQLDKHILRAFGNKKQQQIVKGAVWELDLNGLQLKEKIACATCGRVYRASYNGQDVVVKVFEENTTFRRQVSVLHKLSHGNITKFIGALMVNNLQVPSKDGNQCCSKACCVVVEYIQGETLKQYLTRNRTKKLEFKIVVQLALDLCRGLSYLHSRKIVHRDIKPENLLLDSSTTCLKIVDFGIARVEARNPSDMTGQTGTVAYMAPEVIDGKPYDKRCDVYSVGICLWEIYCCDMPYRDLGKHSGVVEIACGVVEKNLRPKIPGGCPSSFASIIRKCWHSDPNKRPSMDQVVEMLERISTNKGGSSMIRGCFSLAPGKKTRNSLKSY